jgi:hypothetical protein
VCGAPGGCGDEEWAPAVRDCAVARGDKWRSLARSYLAEAGKVNGKDLMSVPRNLIINDII